MGTNFYLRGWEYDEETKQYTELRRYSSTVPSDEAGYHIGKRSAAGLFCWDCNETLTIGGKNAIHRSASGTRASCEKCGKKPEERPSLTTGAAGVELGFAKPRAARPTGVSSCASFTWAQPEEVFTAFVNDHLDHAVVIDEYGRIMSGQEFVTMLECNCPVRFHDMVGRYFS